MRPDGRSLGVGNILEDSKRESACPDRSVRVAREITSYGSVHGCGNDRIPVVGIYSDVVETVIDAAYC